MQVTLFRRAAALIVPGSEGNISGAGCQRGENWIEILNHVPFAADHHTIAPFQPPYAATGSCIYIMNSFRAQRLRTSNVIDVVGISAINEDIVAFQVRQNNCDRLVHGGCRNHQPHGSRFTELLRELPER